MQRGNLLLAHSLLLQAVLWTVIVIIASFFLKFLLSGHFTITGKETNLEEPFLRRRNCTWAVGFQLCALNVEADPFKPKCSWLQQCSALILLQAPSYKLRHGRIHAHTYLKGWPIFLSCWPKGSNRLLPNITDCYQGYWLSSTTWW